MNKKIVPALAFIGATLGSGAALADSFADLRLTLSYNDNLSYGNYDCDILDDTVATLAATYGMPRPAGEYGTLSYVFTGKYDAYGNYSDLNTASLQAGVFYKRKLGVGTNVPWYQLGATAEYRSVADSLRDAAVLDLSASVGKRFTDRISAKLGYAYNQADADNATFDTRMHSASLSGDYLLSDDWVIFGSFSHYAGDVVANANPNSYIIAQAAASVSDPAFGSGRYAYRLDARTNVIGVGANYYLSDTSSLELAYQQRDSDIGYYTSYVSNIYTLNYLYSF